MIASHTVHIRRCGVALTAALLAGLAGAASAQAETPPLPTAPVGLTWDGATVSWDAPPAVPSIARVHWELCRNWTGVAPTCLTAAGPAAPFPLTDAMVPLSPPPTPCTGVWSQLRVWFEDTSGNTNLGSGIATLARGATPKCVPPTGPELPPMPEGPATSAGPAATRTQTRLAVGGRLTAVGTGGKRRQRVTITATAKPGEAGGTVRLRVTGKQGRRQLSRTRDVRLANGRASFTLTVPKGFRRLSVKATYAGSETHAPSSRTSTVRLP